MTATRGLLIDWGDGGGWVDETAYLMHYTVGRGNAPEITGGASPGSGTFILDNTTGRFSPSDTGGPLYGYLEDGPKVWLGIKTDGTFAAGGTVRGLFAGRITDLTPIPAGGASEAPTCEIVCEDALNWYGRQQVLIADSTGRNQKTLRAAILAAIPETRTSLALEPAPLPISSASGDALSLLTGLNAASGTRHWIRPADNPTDWYDYVTTSRMDHLNGVADSDLDASPSSDHVTSLDGWRVSGSTVINQQRATVTPVSFPLAKGTVWSYSDVLPISVLVGRPVTVFADFQDFVSDPELVITSSGAAVVSTITSFGTTAKIVLTVASSRATVTALSIKGYLVARAPDVTIEANDTASQAKPRGRRTGPDIQGDFVGTVASAGGITSHMVYRYGSPKLRPSATVVNWFPEMFDRDLFDILAFTSPQLDAASVLMEIVGLQLEGNLAATSAVSHTVVYQLQESRVQSPKAWFTWDVDKWDTGPGVLGY